MNTAQALLLLPTPCCVRVSGRRALPSSQHFPAQAVYPRRTQLCHPGSAKNGRGPARRARHQKHRFYQKKPKLLFAAAGGRVCSDVVEEAKSPAPSPRHEMSLVSYVPGAQEAMWPIPEGWKMSWDTNSTHLRRPRPQRWAASRGEKHILPNATLLLRGG